MSANGNSAIAGLSAVKLALAARRLRAAGGEAELLEREPIAIVGLACRFPAAPTPEAFWELLHAGRDAVTAVPRDRWDADALYDPDPEAPGRTRCRAGAFLDDVRGFDAGFFHISAREAALLDPQQRLLLEVAWEALERAGLATESPAAGRTGVFVGVASGDYAQRQIAQRSQAVLDAHFGSGNATSFAAGRLSYFLGARGPSMAVDTACSSSLVALHLACTSLRRGECDLALAGGVHLMLSEWPHLYLSRIGALAPDGRSKAFDASADGFGRGEGCGVVALRRLSDALADGDQVLALVRGSAVNQDGASGGLTVPSGAAQESVVRDALAVAGVEPDAVSYVEAHGTGTLLGDPIELRALAAVFGGRPAAAPLAVGSVKANIGHLEAAAGVAGLIKVVLAIEHAQLPRQPYLHDLNAHIPWAQMPIEVPLSPRAWPAADGARRVAGVSAFGLSGTNAHVVVESAPALPALERAQAPLHVLPVSARSRAAFDALTARLADHLGGPGRDASLADVCLTAGAGRIHGRHRGAVVGRTAQELSERLRGLSPALAPYDPPRIAMLLSGEGDGEGDGDGAGAAQAGRLLHATQPVFRDALDRCAEIMAAHDDEPLHGAAALCALQWSLAALWRSWGIVPDAVLGHGAGEHSAACIAGDVPVEDLLATIERRAAGAAPDDERFSAGLRALYDAGHRVFVELGPQPVLCELGRRCLPGDTLWLPSPGTGGDAGETLLDALSTLYSSGASVDWAGVVRPFGGRRTLLPTYPFQRTPYWAPEEPPAVAPAVASAGTPVVAPEESPAAAEAPAPAAPGDAGARREQILHELTAAVATALGEPAAQIDPRTPFVELGADSVMLAEAIRDIEQRYGVKLALRRLFEDLGDLAALSAHLSDRPALPRPAPPSPSPSPSPAPSAAPAHGPLERPRRASGEERSAEAEAVRRHAKQLAARYNPRTATSKRLAERDRPGLADSRASAGFRPSTKELLYPIVGERSDGAHLWDVDGNRYVDISMDFGVNLFGHRAPFLQAALREQLDRGMELAPRPRLAGEVAGLLCALTGMERAVFCQSGSEAVMTALRLARLASGRSRVALFRHAYHGHTDGVLGTVVETAAGERRAVPVGPGIPPNVADNLLVLDYGDERALDEIAAHAGQLAAVLVEPVQSRRPELQPRDFLHALRRLTDEHGIALVFDEMLTGLRPCPGGAQEFFGVRVDLATYGKVLGGGLPLAAVAGRRDLLDGIDGGGWAYGDDSYPGAETTFFAGTFNCYPLSMAAAHAVLTEIARRGPQLQRDLNALTDRLAGTLNGWLQEREAPLRVVHFGSLLRFSGARHLDLLAFHLLEKGVFVWEGRNCFLSAAHSDDDVDEVVDAVQRSVTEMQAAGCFGGAARRPASAREDTFATSEAQRQLWLLSQLEDDGAACAYIESVAVELDGPLDAGMLEAALARTVARHEALRTTIEPGGQRQRVHASMTVALERADLASAGEAEREQLRRRWLENFVARPFALERGPLIRAGLVRLGDERALLAVAVHHAVVDGWSLAIVLRELASAYCAIAERRDDTGPAPAQFRHFLAAQARRATAPAAAADLSYWAERLAGAPPPLELASDRLREGERSWRGGRAGRRLDADLRARLEQCGHAHGATLFMTLLAAYLGFLHRVSGEDDLVVGCPVLGREKASELDVVGYCTHLLPIRSRFTGEQPFGALLERVRRSVLDALDHRDVPFAQLLGALDHTWNDGRPPLVGAVFNLDRPPAAPGFPGVRGRIAAVPVAAAKFELLLNVVDAGGALMLDLDYDVGALGDEGGEELADRFLAWLERLAAQPDEPVGRVPVGDAAERRMLVEEWSAGDVASAGDTSVPARIRDAARRGPHEPALVAAGGERMTYGELDGRVVRIAARLRALGIGAEDRVAIDVARRFDSIVAQLGVLAAGAACVLPSGDGRDTGEARLRLVDASDAAAGAPATVAFDELLGDAGDDAGGDDGGDDGASAPLPERLAYVVAGVGLTHANLRQHVVATATALELAPGDRVLTHPGADADGHGHGWALNAVAALAANACVVLPDDDGGCDPRRIARLLADERVTHLSAGGSEHAWLLEVLDERPPALRAVAISSAAPGTGLAGRGRGRDARGPVRLATLCTPAGAGAIVAWDDAGGDGPPAGAAVPIGRPVAGARLYVLDSAGELAPRGTPGELAIGGEAVARGVLGHPAATAARFVPDPFGPEPGGRLYRTGHRVRHRRDGTLEWHVRRVAAAPAPAPHVAPRTAVEAAVAARFAEVLGLQRVGACDDFFVLGGHSLPAVQIVMWAREQFAVELSLRTLFQCPTVERFAQAIERAPRAGATQPPLVRVPREAHRMARAELHAAHGTDRR